MACFIFHSIMKNKILAGGTQRLSIWVMGYGAFQLRCLEHPARTWETWFYVSVCCWHFDFIITSLSIPQFPCL